MATKIVVKDITKNYSTAKGRLNVIGDIKVAAAQDKIKLSHVVEEAVREWLARRKH